MITSAPSARSSRAFSCDIVSGMVKTQRYPFTAAASASPTPVLPDVASTIRPPGLRRPSRSAASIIATPMRSFTDPPGLKNSALAYTGVRIPCVTRFSRTSGVQPMVSRILPYGLVWDAIRVRLRRAVGDGARRVQALWDRVALHLLVVQPGRVLDRRVGVQGHRRLLVRRNAGRPASRLLGRGCLAASGGTDAQEAGERDGADSHGPSASCFFHAASRFNASSGDSVFTSSRSSSSSSG